MQNRFDLRKTSALLVALAVIPASASPRSLSQTVIVNSSDVSIRQEGQFDRLRMPQTITSPLESAPNVPFRTAWFVIDENEDVSSAQVIGVESWDPGRSLRMAPVGVLRFDGAGKAASTPLVSRADQWQPEMTPIWSTGWLRGLHVASVSYPAAQTQTIDGRVRVWTNLEVRIETTELTRPEGHVTPERVTTFGAQAADEALALVGLASAAVVGPLDRRQVLLRPLVNSGAPFAPTFRPSIEGSPVDMVIITSSAQADSYQVLADFKTKIGVATVVRTVDWIRANYLDGVDTPATIRAFIRDAYTKWGTTYVLLGGDTEVVPVRKVQTIETYGEVIASDLYYSCLDGTWNADGDAIYGEAYRGPATSGDDVDFLPEVYVGRLPSNDHIEAGLLVRKSLKYQRTPPSNFALKTLFLGEVLFPQVFTHADTPYVEVDGAEICDALFAYGRIPAGFASNLTRLYENHTQWFPAKEEIRDSVIVAINSGYGLIHFIGHGYINTMSVGKDGGQLKNGDVEDFTNGSRAGVVFAMTCNAAAIESDCIAESWLRAPNGGAVALISNSSVNYIEPELSYQDEWYRLTLAEQGLVLGKTTADARILFEPIADYLGYRTLLFNTILLGDPELPMWGEPPKTFSITHSGTFSLGSGTYSVTVRQSTTGTPVVPGARVCLHKAGDAYSVGTTDAMGVVALPFRPDLTGSFSIGVYAKNFVPYVDTTGTVSTVSSTANVFAARQLVDDDVTGSSNGNADIGIDAGETIELRVRLKNSGTATAQSVACTLSTASSYLTITDNTSAYSNIAAGDSAVASDPIVLSVARGTPDRTEIPCTLQIGTSAGSHSQKLILYVRAPVYEVFQWVVRDSIGMGPGDSTITADEDFAVRVYIRNVGHGSGRSVQLRLRPVGSATVLDSTLTLGTVVCDGSLVTSTSDVLKAKFSSVSGNPRLRLVITDYYGEIQNQLVDVLPPSPVNDVTPRGAETSIQLSWEKSAQSDVQGYNVYRTNSPTGAFGRVSETHGEQTTFYQDEGLSSFTRYYYQVAAVDSSGNEGPRSSTATATTSLPLHPGFPVSTDASTTSGITIADLDGDGIYEIIFGAEEVYVLEPDGSEYLDGDHDTRTSGPFSNTGGLQFWNTPAVGDLDHDGTPEVAAVSWLSSELFVWDAEGVVLDGFPKALNISEPASEDPNPLGSVTMADIDADANLELIVQCDSLIFVFQHDGEELIDGDGNQSTDGVFASFEDRYNYSTPSVADVYSVADPYGDPRPETFATSRDGKLYGWSYDGSDIPGFPINIGGNMTSSPAIGDIDGDGRAEIIFGSSPVSGAPAGFVEAQEGRRKSGNGSSALSGRGPQVMPKSIASVSPKIMLHLAGVTAKNKCANGNISSCSEAVVTGDLGTQTEYFAYVLAAEYNTNSGMAGISFGIDYNQTMSAGVDVHNWNLCAATHHPTSGWPQSGTGILITWDPETTGTSGCQTDAIAVAGYFYISVYSPDVMSITENPATGLAMTTNCQSVDQTLLPEDLGSVGFNEAGSSPCNQSLPEGGLLHAYRVDGTQVTYDSGNSWPMAVPMGADFDSSPALGDLDGDGKPDVVIGGSDGFLYAFSGRTGEPIYDFPVEIEHLGGDAPEIRSSPVIADINDDGSPEIFVGDQAGLVHGFAADGDYLEGFPMRTGALIEGGLAVWDLDGDGEAELIALSYDKRCYRWDVPSNWADSTASWPMFKRGPSHAGTILRPIFPGQTGVPEPSPSASSLKVSVASTILSTQPATFEISGVTGKLSMQIVNVAGQVVWSVPSAATTGGSIHVQWHLLTQSGHRVPSGIYFARVVDANAEIVQRLVVVR